jgi:hypothetical protein
MADNEKRRERLRPRRPPSRAADGQETFPPALVQAAASDVSVKPWPLQAFCPLHEDDAVLQALWPLQAFAPVHFTPAASAGEDTVATVPAAKKAAAAAARTTPFSFDIRIVSQEVSDDS